VLPELLHDQETHVCGDQAYPGLTEVIRWLPPRRRTVRIGATVIRSGLTKSSGPRAEPSRRCCCGIAANGILGARIDRQYPIKMRATVW